MTRGELYNLERDYFNSFRESDKKNLTDYSEAIDTFCILDVDCDGVNCKDCILNVDEYCILCNGMEETEKLLVEWKASN